MAQDAADSDSDMTCFKKNKNNLMIFCMLYLFNTNVFAHRSVLPVLRPRHFLQGLGAADPLLPVRTPVVIL